MLIFLSLLGEHAWPPSRDRVHANERWFRDTQPQCCPLIEAQLPLYLLGSAQEPQPSTESSLLSSRFPQSGCTPLFEEKASQMLPAPAPTGRHSVCSQEPASSSSHPLLWVWTHTLHSSCLGLLWGIVVLPALPHSSSRIAAGNCLCGWMILFWPHCLFHLCWPWGAPQRAWRKLELCFWVQGCSEQLAQL